MLFIGVILVSCGNDEPTSQTESSNRPDNYEIYKDWYETLMDTSWELTSSKSYYADGKIKDNTLVTHQNESAKYKKYLSTIMTLTSNPDVKSYTLHLSTIPGNGEWWIEDNGELIILNSYWTGNPGNVSATDMGLFSRFFPLKGTIEECTSSKLVISENYESAIYTKYIFSRVYGYNPDDGGGNGGDDSNYELPEIGLVDYTLMPTSITLKYRIYNQSEAKVTSAIGYYGTSSPSNAVSATLTGSLITIQLTSLRKGTTYYVKCTARGKGGSATSEITKVSTLYN